MTEGLLPCWACFKEGAQMYMARSKFYIICPHCRTITPYFMTSVNAANWWNEKYIQCKKSETKCKNN